MDQPPSDPSEEVDPFDEFTHLNSPGFYDSPVEDMDVHLASENDSSMYLDTVSSSSDPAWNGCGGCGPSSPQAIIDSSFTHPAAISNISTSSIWTPPSSLSRQSSLSSQDSVDISASGIWTPPSSLSRQSTISSQDSAPQLLIPDASHTTFSEDSLQDGIFGDRYASPEPLSGNDQVPGTPSGYLLPEHGRLYVLQHDPSNVS